MNYQRITDVPVAAQLEGEENLYIQQGDTFRRVSIADFLTALGIQDGNDGVSPTISITTITGGHRLTITDAGGPKTVDVMDGPAGADGGYYTPVITTPVAGKMHIAFDGSKPGMPAVAPVDVDLPTAPADTSGVASINKLDGVLQLPISGLGTCGDAVSAQTKTINVSTIGFELHIGTIFAVRFTNPGNTADRPQLKIGAGSYPVISSIDNRPVSAVLMSKAVHLFMFAGNAAILLDPHAAAEVATAIERGLTS